jgi:hypothetical protein
VNASGFDATIKNNDATDETTSANLIITGTGSDLTLANNASVSLVYDSVSSVWRVIGTQAGGGGGSGVSAVNTYTGAITIQGTANRISVSGSSGTITLNGPQDINTTAAVTFGSLTVGSAGNTVMLDTTSGITLAGTARHTKRITLTPEYSGAVFHSPGSSNVGYMTSDFVTGLTSGQGYKHNYYQWSTDQTSAQAYDIVVRYQLPSDFDGFASSTPFNLWNFAKDTSYNNVKYDIYDASGNDCYGSMQTASSTTNTWILATLGNPTSGSCSFNANDVVTIIIEPSADATATTNDVMQVGEFQFDYKAKF